MKGTTENGREKPRINPTNNAQTNALITAPIKKATTSELTNKPTNELTNAPKNKPTSTAIDAGKKSETGSGVSAAYRIYTFGCKVNTYDSGLMDQNLKRWGFNDHWKERRIHILNTCAVTAEATKEAVKNIRKIKSKDPFSTVVVTGCSAQVDTGVFEVLPGADLVVANSHKSFLPEILDQYFKGEIKEKIFKSNIFRKDDLEAGGGEETQHTRAFLKIQDGCNSFCSYCIIPYARGKSRSIPVEVLVHRIRDLEKAGYGEVVLTGVHIGDYQDEQGQTKFVLEDLIEGILKKTSIPRIRLTSLEPPELTPRLLDLFENPRMCQHFHMSIQSAETQVLKDMKRHYEAPQVEEALQELHRRFPKAFVGMDVIVGFPTETEERFKETYERLLRSPWTRLHVFPYSERQGTRAAHMTETVVPAERQRRSEFLRELSWNRHQSRAEAQVGDVKKVLLLREKEGRWLGLSRDYWNVEIVDGASADWSAGQEVQVRVEGWIRPSLSNFEVRLQGIIAGPMTEQRQELFS